MRAIWTHANANLDAYSPSNSYPDRDRYANCDTHRYSDANVDGNDNSERDCYANGNAHVHISAITDTENNSDA